MEFVILQDYCEKFTTDVTARKSSDHECCSNVSSKFDYIKDLGLAEDGLQVRPHMVSGYTRTPLSHLDPAMNRHPCVSQAR